MSTNANATKRRFKKVVPLLQTVLTTRHLRSNPYQNSVLRPSHAKKEIEAFELSKENCKAVMTQHIAKAVNEEAYIKFLDRSEDLKQHRMDRANQEQNKSALCLYGFSECFTGTVFDLEEAFRGLRDARRNIDKITTTIQAHGVAVAHQLALRTQYNSVCHKIELNKKEIELMRKNAWIMEIAAHRWAINEAEAAGFCKDKREGAMAYFEAGQAVLVQQAEDLWRQMRQSREAVQAFESE